MALAEFQGMLDRFVSDAKERKPKVIAGDFNAWNIELEILLTNARGRSLLKPLTQLDIISTNDDQLKTYRKEGTGSVVDLTFISPSLAHNMTWTIVFDLKSKSYDGDLLVYE